MAKKGKLGGGDGGGGASQNLTLIGTNGADRLIGSDGDDVLIGHRGNDILKGGSGTDTAVFSGSILDFSWTGGKRGSLYVTDNRGIEGTDTLYDIEVLQFDDFTYKLSGDNLPVVQFQVPTTDVDTIVTFTATVYDLDDTHAGVSSQYTKGLWQNGVAEYTGIANGQMVTATYTFDPTTYQLDHLAEGEVFTVDFNYNYGSIYQGIYQGTSQIHITGKNDVPTMGYATLAGKEDAGVVSTDLAAIGDDIDSDDDGASLSYQIVGNPDGLNVWIDGTELKFDPGTDFQKWNDGEVLTFIVQVVAIDGHGAVSGVRDITVTLEGTDDPLADYLNADGSVDYNALGLDPSNAPVRGIQTGVVGDASTHLNWIQYTNGDDAQIFNGTGFGYYGDFGGLYEYYGFTEYSDLTLNTADGNDLLVYYLRGADTGIESYDANMGTGEDIWVLDIDASSHAIARFIDLNTGDNNDQVLIEMQSQDALSFSANDFYLGAGNDLVNISLNATGDGSGTYFGSIAFRSDFYLGDGNDTMIVDIAVQNALTATIDTYIIAGEGDDYIRFDNTGSTVANDTFLTEKTGFYGTIDLGSGDDVLDLFVFAQAGEAADGWVEGGVGYDVANLAGSLTDWSIVEVASWGAYDLTRDGQTIRLNNFEEINVSDGNLLDLIA